MQTETDETEYAVYFSRNGANWHTRDPIQWQVVRSLMNDGELIRIWAGHRIGVQSRGFYMMVVEMRLGWFRTDLNRTVGSEFFSRRDIRVVPTAELQPQFGFEDRDGALYIPVLSVSEQGTEFLDTRL